MTERYIPHKTDTLESIVYDDLGWAKTTLEFALKGVDIANNDPETVGENEILSVRLIRPWDIDSEEDGYEVRLEITQYYPDDQLPKNSKE